MLAALKELIAHQDLLFMITWREIKVKYKQSVMGMLWAVLMPLVIVFAGLIVRFAFAKISGKPLSMMDLTSVTVKAAPWAFFVSALRFGTNSLIANEDLVTKVYLPRLIFPLAAVCSQLFDFVIASTVVIVFLLVVGSGFTVQLLWVPLLVLATIVLAASLAILSSAASLFFRDAKFIVEVFLTFAIFFTPVFYESSMFGKWGPVLLLNPVSSLLEGLSNTIVLHQSPNLGWLAYSLAFTSVFFVVAMSVFKHYEPFFAENV